MMKNVSPRLSQLGGPHHASPDKDPTRRLATLRAMAAQRVPATTGILVGVGGAGEEGAGGIFGPGAPPRGGAGPHGGRRFPAGPAAAGVPGVPDGGVDRPRPPPPSASRGRR